MEASDGSESVAARRVRTRRTWTLSMACGVSGWLLIACMIVWGVVNILMATNEDGATLRDYGFVVAIFGSSELSVGDRVLSGGCG